MTHADDRCKHANAASIVVAFPIRFNPIESFLHTEPHQETLMKTTMFVGTTPVSCSARVGANAIGFAVLLLLIGCASAPPPIPRDSTLMATIMVYPIRDVREKPDPKLSDCNLAKPFGEKFFHPVNGLIQNASELGYQFEAPASAVAEMSPESLKSQRRGEEHYFLATSITRFVYYGASLRYSIESVLVRADDGSVVWKRTNTDSEWLGIIGGIADALLEKVGNMSKCGFVTQVLGATYKQMPELEKY